MGYTVSIPERLARAIRARDFDVEAFVVESLEKEPGAGPHGGAGDPDGDR